MTIGFFLQKLKFELPGYVAQYNEDNRTITVMDLNNRTVSVNMEVNPERIEGINSSADKDDTYLTSILSSLKREIAIIKAKQQNQE